MFSCILLLFTLGIFHNAQSQNYLSTDCYNDTTINNYPINPGEFVFFQSPNFPYNLYKGFNESIIACNGKFIIGTQPYSLWISMINGKIGKFKFYDASDPTINSVVESFDSNSNIATFSSTSNYLGFELIDDEWILNYPWTAFQSIVVSYDPTYTNYCPFSQKTIDLKDDERMVIPISSDFNDKNAKDCSWTFNIAPNRYLKVIVQRVTFDSPASFRIENDTGLVLDFHGRVSFSGPGTYYFDGKNFEIAFFRGATDNSKIYALVSSVAKENPKITECQTSECNGTITVSNWDDFKGYGEFENCQHILDIPVNYELFFEMSRLEIEECCDTLSFQQPKQTIQFISSGLVSYALTHDSDKTSLNFKSDGNIQQAGFEARYTVEECICSDSQVMIPCNDNDNDDVIITPMPNFEGNYSTHYCSNLNCSYNIISNPNCPKQVFSLQTYTYMRGNDKLSVYSNNHLDQEFTSPNFSSSEVAYTSKANLKANFISGSSPSVLTEASQYWTMILHPLTNFTLTNIILNETNPIFTLWLDDLDLYDAFSICSTTKDLEIFVGDGSTMVPMNQFGIYDSENFVQYLGLLDSNFIASNDGTIPRNLKSTSGCFTLSRSRKYTNSLATVVFRIPRVHSKNCQMQYGNIRQFPSKLTLNPLTFTTQSGDGGSCELIILVSSFTNPGIGISNITTVVTGKEVFVFKSAFNNKQFFNVSASDFMWANFGILTPALSIVPPSGSKIDIQAKVYSDTYKEYPDNNYLVHEGIITSSSYSGLPAYTANYSLLHQFSYYEDVLINFVVKDLSNNSRVVIYDSSLQSEHMLKSIGQELTILGRNIYVELFEDASTNSGVLIFYTVRPNPNPPPTTPKSDSMPKLKLEYIFIFISISFNLFMNF